MLTPGPAVLYIVARSLDQGRLAGFVSVLSIEVGNIVHVLAATLGLSAILVSSAFDGPDLSWFDAFPTFFIFVFT